MDACNEACSWLTKHAWTVPEALTPDDLSNRTKRAYTLTKTSILKTRKFGTTGVTEVMWHDVTFTVHKVVFEDGTFELIYYPLHGLKDKIWESSKDARKNTFGMYSVAQVAEQIAYMHRVQLKAIDGFYIVPIFMMYDEKNHHPTGQYSDINNSIYLYAQDKSKLTESDLAGTLMHEGGHALDDRWYNVAEKFIKLGKEKDGDTTKKIEQSKARLDELTKKIDAQCKKPLYFNSVDQNLALGTEKKLEQLNCDILESLHKDQLAKLQKAYDKAVQARQQWENAVKADKYWRVSGYSKEGRASDDFAEHCAAYILAYGTECEALMRKHMPNRAKVLDYYFSNKPTPASSKPLKTKAATSTSAKQLDNSGKDEGSSQPSGAAGGGGGETVAYNQPLMVMSAPAGIALLTPQSASFNAGLTTSIAAGQDINLLAQANAAHMVKAGISLFTYGKASNPKKPNQEVGISLHAASGKVSSQSQSDKTMVTADKAITIASTTDAVTIQAPKHVLLTAQGAYIKMSGGNIEVHAPGKVDIKASMKSWTSPKSDSNSLTMAKSGKLKVCEFKAGAAANGGDALVAV